jgi:hypothetical protein
MPALGAGEPGSIPGQGLKVHPAITSFFKQTVPLLNVGSIPATPD